MRRTTYRQYLAWRVWLRDRWENPDHCEPGSYAITRYLMQLNRDVLGIFSKKPLKLDQFKLKFADGKTPKMDARTASMYEMGRWMAALGMLRKRRQSQIKPTQPSPQQSRRRLPIKRVQKRRAS